MKQVTLVKFRGAVLLKGGTRNLVCYLGLVALCLTVLSSTGTGIARCEARLVREWIIAWGRFDVVGPV